MTMPYWAERLRVRMIHELGGYTDEDVAEGYVTWAGVRRMLKEYNVEVELV